MPVYRSMLINAKKFLSLPVFTQSGIKLGKVFDITLDVNSHLVREYVVKEGTLTRQSKLIKPAQVVAITEEKMIVDDCLADDKVNNRVLNAKSAPAPAMGNVATIEEE